MSTVHRLLACALAVALAVDHAPAAEHGDSRVPAELDDGWKVASPAQFGAGVALLDSMNLRLEVGDYEGIHSVLVAKDGVLVFEEYFDGHRHDTLHEIRSATKSIGSILTGIAIDRGFMGSETAPMCEFFMDDYRPADGWTDQARQVEIRHLLSMVSGYDCDDLATDFACEDAMYGTDDWVQYSLDMPFAHALGERWAYNSSSLILVGEAVARASGLELSTFADHYLFEPLGIERFRWLSSPKGRAWIGGGARMVPREMAKVGQLMLNRGLWNGDRILSEEWVDKSTAKQSEPMTGVDYGYLWQRAESYVGRELVSAFWASGNGGQYIIVLPEEGMVIVFTGGNYDSPLAGQPFQILTDYILPAFVRPVPPETVTLSQYEEEKLAGTYGLEFEESATSTISVDGSQISLTPPGSEPFELVAHSPTFFTGNSQFGPVTVVFEADGTGRIVKHTIYGGFQRFVFRRD